MMAPVMSYVTVEPFEVRHEILVSGAREEPVRGSQSPDNLQYRL